MKFISDEIKTFLHTPAGRKALRLITPDMQKQIRLAIKNNLINPPEKFQRLFDIKIEIERLYAVYKEAEKKKGKSKKNC